jgi:hypothetical protein
MTVKKCLFSGGVHFTVTGTPIPYRGPIRAIDPIFDEPAEGGYVDNFDAYIDDQRVTDVLSENTIDDPLASIPDSTMEDAKVVSA